MTTRGGSKQARPATKANAKTPGKDQTKSEKQSSSVVEIVPGKFNETDWLSLLESDDTEDFIADIFENIWSETSKKIQEIYVRKQLLPFTMMITENALSQVIQWAFMERDEAKPQKGDFWTEDTEPVPCTMDNWGEGVVPACREEHPTGNEDYPTAVEERPATAYGHVPPTRTLGRNDRVRVDSPITNSSPTPDSNNTDEQLFQMHKSNNIHLQKRTIKTDDDQLIQNEISMRQDDDRSRVEPKSYYHDVLVIHTQPPQLEPMSDLFYPPNTTDSKNSTSVTSSTKRRRLIPQKVSSFLNSETITSTTDLTGTPTTKNTKRPMELKVLHDQKIEEAIAKAPVAAHAILKSILSRPPGYRELEIDDNGNVVTLTKIDPDKIPPKSIHVKCDVVKPRKPVLEARLPPPSVKSSSLIRSNRSNPKYEPLRRELSYPEQSTDVGDLIQPVPGVLYEDARLRKGDPRRYQSAKLKYTNFYDEARPLQPIAQRHNLSIIKVPTDLLRPLTGGNKSDESGRDSQTPKLHRLARIPPITSGSSTTTT